MHPEDFTSKNLQDWEAKLEELLKGIEVPVTPVHISKQVTPKKIKILAQLKSLHRGIIRVSYGPVVK